jgi:hypothetical protein
VKEYPQTVLPNHCVAPEEIEDGDLLAFVEGEASPAVRAHLARCLYCTQEAAALHQVNALFAAAHYRAGCPATEQLLGYQAGLLAPAENKRLKQHVNRCPHCQAELAELAGESPPSALNRLATAVSHSLKEAGKQVIEAILLPDPGRPALALRGESQQHAVYQAGSYQLVLARAPPIAGENLWQLEGQLLTAGGSPAAIPAGQVSFWRDGHPAANDVVDELGYFALANIRPGVYELSIELTTSLLLIPAITIP